MPLLENLKKKKDRLKDAVTNMVTRARGNKQEGNVVRPAKASRRSPSPVGSNWDSSDSEEVDPQSGFCGRIWYSEKKDPTGKFPVEKKLSLDARTSASLGQGHSSVDYGSYGNGCSRSRRNEPETPRQTGILTSRQTGIQTSRQTGIQTSVRRDRESNVDVPDWKVQQWKENHGATSTSQYKHSQRECYAERVVRVQDIPRPKCSYRRSRPINPPPLKPHKSTRAAGFVSRKPDPVTKAVLNPRCNYRPDPKTEAMLDFDHLRLCKDSKKPGREIYRETGEKSGEGSSSRRTSKVVSNGDPLDGFDDLLSDVERLGSRRNSLKAGLEVGRTSTSKNDTSYLWSPSKERIGSMDWETSEIIKRQRAQRKRELKTMDQLLEELDC